MQDLDIDNLKHQAADKLQEGSTVEEVIGWLEGHQPALRPANRDIDHLIESICMEQSGYSWGVPDKYKHGVWQKALEAGRSGKGYEDLHNELVSLVEIFTEYERRD